METPSKKFAALRRAGFWLVAGGVVLPTVTFAFSGLVICVLPAVGIICALVGLVLGIQARRQAAVVGNEGPRIRRFPFALAGAAVLVLLVNWGLGLASLSHVREAAKSPLGRAALRTLFQALQIYHDEFGDYPPTLHALAHDEPEQLKRLQHPFDPAADVEAVRNGYSSFVYLPGRGTWRSDPGLILMHERQPFSSTEMRLRARQGYNVLFADGTTAWFLPIDFEALLQADRELRRKVGWPVGVEEGTQERRD